MSEFERQSKLFADKVANPDEIIVACSYIKAEYDDGDMYHFLTCDDKIIRVTLREEDKPE